MDKPRKDSIEGLKDTLYSRGQTPKSRGDKRTPLSASDAHAPVAWNDGVLVNNKPPILESAPTTNTQFVPEKILAPMTYKKRMSLATKFFIASAAFFFLAAGAAAYIFFYGGNTISPSNIDLQIIAPSLIDGGKQSTLQILASNRNNTALESVSLVIDYPDGTRDPNDQTKKLTHERQVIGTIVPGQQIKRAASAFFYGQEGAQQKVHATLEYTFVGSNAVFQKQADIVFTIGSSPVSVSITAPNEAIAGQNFNLDVTVQSNATTPITDVVIQGQYPFGFSLVSAAPQADTNNTLWRLGTLNPGESTVLHLVGKIDGQDGDERVFRFLAGSDSDQTEAQIKVPFLSVPQTITVHKPFITASVALNGQDGRSVAVGAGKLVQGTIKWQNNLNTTVSNVELKLLLAGPMLDRTSINSNDGFYQSADNTITWSKNQTAELASIPPGGTGTLQFSFLTTQPGVGGVVYTNPTIDLNLTVSGVREGQSGVPDTVSSAASAQASVTSSVSLLAQALHFSGPFTNTGPMPPIAEQYTSYTIVWTVNNSSNSIANATVSASLPPYVTFVSTPAGSGITYNAPSRTVSWSLGDIKAGAGYTGPARTAAFQVRLLPSALQAGQAPALTTGATFSGQDRFAQVQLQATAGAPTTMLSGDSGFQSNMGQVLPKQ